MSWTFRTKGGTGGGSGSSTTVATTLTGIVAGDLICIGVKWEGSAGTVTVSDGTSSLTQSSVGVQQNNGNQEPFLSVFYLFSSVASGSVTYTATFDSARTWRCIVAMAYSYTGGSPSLDGTPGGNTATSGTSVSSGNITTSGTDGLAFGIRADYGGTISSMQINGVAADQSQSSENGQADAIWSKTYSSGFTGAATGTLNGSNRWNAQVIAFKLATASALAPPPVRILQAVNRASRY